MEIQVGEFIRTKNGTIGKIKRIDFDEIDKSLKWYIYDKKDYITGIVEEQAINKPYIKSHSFNITEILEEGDYVNGQKVVGVQSGWIDTKENVIHKDHIKSVVTKEQFKAMEYEVK